MRSRGASSAESFSITRLRISRGLLGEVMATILQLLHRLEELE